MTESEAIKIIKEKVCNNRCIPQLCNDGCMYENIKCAFSMAIKALEKQIPKKPTDRCMYKECPACGEVEIEFCKYCPSCGQKLDWRNKK